MVKVAPGTEKDFLKMRHRFSTCDKTSGFKGAVSPGGLLQLSGLKGQLEVELRMEVHRRPNTVITSSRSPPAASRQPRAERPFLPGGVFIGAR